jgi:hypothetical protein
LAEQRFDLLDLIENLEIDLLMEKKDLEKVRSWFRSLYFLEAGEFRQVSLNLFSLLFFGASSKSLILLFVEEIK